MSKFAAIDQAVPFVVIERGRNGSDDQAADWAVCLSERVQGAGSFEAVAEDYQGDILDALQAAMALSDTKDYPLVLNDDAAAAIMERLQELRQVREELPAADRALRLRERAAGLLREAQQLDGLHCFTVAHPRDEGVDTYVAWERIPTLLVERAALLCEGRYHPRTGELYTDRIPVEILAGLKGVLPPVQARTHDEEGPTP